MAPLIPVCLIDSGTKAAGHSSAKEITWKFGFVNSHCLCHGNFGNAELFRIGDDDSRVNQLVQMVVDDYVSKEHWQCGLPAGTTTPGLMCGLAGIGYGLLRAADPIDIPNVLALDGPIQMSGR